MLKSLHLHCQLCGLVACSPDLGMMDAVFSIVCLKVLFIDLLLFCMVDGSVLQETKVLLIGPLVVMNVSSPTLAIRIKQ